MTGIGKTVTRVDLCEAVYQKVGLSRTESSAFVELVLKEITDCLERGETVKLSSFGSFMVRKKGERIGRNPKTGTEVPISPRRVMVTCGSSDSLSEPAGGGGGSGIGSSFGGRVCAATFNATAESNKTMRRRMGMSLGNSGQFIKG